MAATTPEALAALKEAAGQGVAIRETSDGEVEIAITGRVDPTSETAIAGALPEAERRGFAEAVARYRHETRDALSPAERGETFAVPQLMAEVQGALEFADTERFMEEHEWSLLDHSPRLSETEFALRETARMFEIDIDGASVKYQKTGEEAQHALDVSVEGWTAENLAIWLDGQVRQPYIRPAVLLRWLRDMVGHLTGPRGIHIAALMRCKFILARKIRDKIDAIRRSERNNAYQRYLFAPEAKVEVSFDENFAFREGMYADQRRYRGRWKPSKHFLGPDNVPAFDGKPDGEETHCAQALDGLPAVRFWIRNVARHPESFSLPTASGRFYPDLVALLEDGRLLVVEYKGALTAEGGDADEKRTIGRLWEQKSGGKGLFIVVEKEVDRRDPRAQLLDKIGK